MPGAARPGEGILRTHGWPAIQFDRGAVEVLAIDVAARVDGPGARSEVFYSASEAGRARWPPDSEMSRVKIVRGDTNGESRRIRLLWFLGLILLAAGCAMPGQPYLVAPAITGNVRGEEIPADGARLMLIAMHRESPNLYERQEIPLSPAGNFSFEPVELVIAGHEFSKHYRIFLHLQTVQRNRVIWRAEFSRRALAGEIALDCDLGRPEAHGQPCWVRDPLRQPWLVAEGKRTFERLCARCHGNDGRGVESSGEALTRRPPDLRAIATRRGGQFDRAEIEEWIEGRSLPGSHGTRLMPIWGERLSKEYERFVEGDEMIGAMLDPVLAYLESLQEAD